MDKQCFEISFEQLNENVKKAGCSYRWNYPIIKYDRAELRTCCQVSESEKVDVRSFEPGAGPERFLNSASLRERKLEMLKGIQHSSCSACWKLEANQIQSMRHRAPELLPYLGFYPSFLRSGTDLYSESDLEMLAKVARPHMLEIHLDNVCDLACLYCNANYSTTWARKTGQKQSPVDPELVTSFQEYFWKWFDEIFFELDGLCIIGGEPLASPNFFKVMERILQVHQNNSSRVPQQQFISITSNFNARPETFEKFLLFLGPLNESFNLSINASCESVGAKAEFIRDGLDWQRFEKNVHRLLTFLQELNKSKQKRRFDFSFHAAQNVLSLTAVKEFLIWAKDLEQQYQVPINLIPNVVSFPDFLSAQSLLPADFSNEILEAAELAQQNRTGFKYVSNCTWQGYADFLRSIAGGLQTRAQEPMVFQRFQNWYLHLNPQKKNQFQIYFPGLVKPLLGDHV